MKQTKSTTSLSRYVAANNILLEEKPFERALYGEFSGRESQYSQHRRHGSH